MHYGAENLNIQYSQILLYKAENYGIMKAGVHAPPCTLERERKRERKL